MLLSDALDAVRSVAPERLAAPWDRVGLQAGDPAAEVGSALLCIDLTEAVVDEAVAAGCGLVVAYHPPVFSPLRGVRAAGGEGGWAERRVWCCVREGVALYSPHTALDAVRGGVCDWLAGCCGAGGSVPIEPAGEAPPRGHKLVVFAPEAAADAVLQALWAAGAGEQGAYDRCAFVSAGTGGFRPLEGADPAVGEIGRREELPERRLEVLVPPGRERAAVAALRAAHPYEEPAFDLLRLEPEPVDPATAPGAGRVLTLDEPVPAETLHGRLRAALGVPLKVGGPPAESGGAIRTVAVCPGSGGKLFEAVDADAYVTGEMQHHQALDLTERGRAVVLAGHTHTERPYLPLYRERLLATAAGGLGWRVSAADAAPLRTV